MRRGLKHPQTEYDLVVVAEGCTDLPDEEGTETDMSAKKAAQVMGRCTDLPDEEGTET